ncbi:MAG: hypothetical protein ACLGIB_07220 [Actinomycetota bacterium]
MKDIAGVKRRIPALGWGLCVLALGGMVAGAALEEHLGRGGNDSLVESIGLLLGFAAFPVIGALIFSRHPQNPLAWIFILIGVAVGILVPSTEYAYLGLVNEPGRWPGAYFAAWLEQWLWYPGLMAIPTLGLLLFPDGRPPSPRWRWVGWASVLVIVLVTGGAMFQSRLQSDGYSIRNPVGFLPFANSEEALGFLFVIFFPLMALSLASVVVRFRRSGTEQRQQLKLLLWAAAVFGLSVTLGDTFDLPEVIFPLTLWMIPGAIGVAILKYRLYDIDLIVNRTLVYSILTSILVLAYLGIVFVLQEALTGVTEDSDLAIAGSTLAVAGLFRPLRGRVQAFIDRRFYRRKYDARQTLESFSSRLRDDVDLEHLTQDLSRVVHDTMQPAHVSVWLRGAGEARS